MSDQSKTVVITGTNSGIGAGTARKLAADGYRVFGTMRDPDGRNATAKRELEAHGVTVVGLDVTDQESVDRGTTEILRQAKHIDVLINTAGSMHVGITEGFTPASVERQFATNVVGPLRMSRAFLPGMRSRKSGLVLFLSSFSGRLVMPFGGVYTASKFAIEAIAESLSYELRPFGVDVAIVEPANYTTNIWPSAIYPDDAPTVESYGEIAKTIDAIAHVLISTAGNPSEVVDTLVALVKAPAGERPLRTANPAGGPLDAVEAAVEPIQRGTLEFYGLGSFLSKRHAAAS
jgi:NAD(P)-dependent dehydrogenase (short-subunit alcohol dehydrogenase family)